MYHIYSTDESVFYTVYGKRFLTSWNPLGHATPVTGLLYLLPFTVRDSVSAPIGKASLGRIC